MRKYTNILEKFLFWETLVLLIFIPLYPKIPLLNITKTFVAIRLEDILIGFSLISLLVYLLISKNVKEFLSDKLTLVIFLFFFIGLVSLFSGIFLTNTVTAHLGFLHYLRRVEYMMLLPLVYYAISSRKQIIYLILTLAGVVLIVNFYAFGQQYLGWPVISTTNSEFSKGLILYLTEGARVNSTFAGHYDLAVFLMMIIVVLSALVFSIKKYYIWGLAAIVGFSSIVVLVMTAARLSFAAAIFGVFLSIIFSGKKILLLLLFGAALIAAFYPSTLRDRLVSTITINLKQEGARYASDSQIKNNRSTLNIPTLPTYEKETTLSAGEATKSGFASDITPGEPTDNTQLEVYRSFAIRLNIEWPRAIRAFTKNPLLGTGYSSLGIATDNDVLRSLGEVGLLGTVAFGLILLEISKQLIKIIKSNDLLFKYLSVGVLSMVIAFGVNGLFIDVFEASKVATVFWMILGMTLAIKKIKNV